MSEPEPLDETLDALSRLKPASSPIDPKEVFYQAGYRACLAERKADSLQAPNTGEIKSGRNRLKLWMPVVAASVFTALLSTPIAYRVGEAQALLDPGNVNSTTEPRKPESMPAAESVPVFVGTPSGSDSIANLGRDEPSPSPVGSAREVKNELPFWARSWHNRIGDPETLTASYLTRGSDEMLKQVLTGQDLFSAAPMRSKMASRSRSEPAVAEFVPPSANLPLAVGDLQKFTLSQESSF